MKLLWLAGAVIAMLGCVPEWVVENGAANDLFRQGRIAEALARYESVVARHPSPEASYNVGTALAALGRGEDALRRLDSALEGASPAVGAATHYNRGIVLFRLGDCARARQAFAAALQLDPDDQDARFNLDLVEGELARGPGQPGGVCQGERVAGGQPSGSESGSDDEDMAAGQDGSQTNEQDPRGNLSQQMRDLLAQLQQRRASDPTTDLNSDHPEMSLAEALRLLEEARARQGGFEAVVHGSSGAIRP